MKKLFNRDYLLILQGNAVSAFGDLLYSVAIGYWVYEQTGSSALMGLMSSISMFVVMFLSPFSGTIIDRINRKSVIVGADMIRGVIMLLVGALAFSGRLSVPVVLLAAFCASLCSVFFSPAISTTLIDVIPHDDMVRGQSIHSGIVSLINLVGKAFSGTLVALLGVPFIVVINGVCYLISALTEIFIRVPKTRHQDGTVSPKTILLGIGRGFQAIWKDKFMKLFIPSVIILNFLGSGPMILMLPFILDKGFTVEMYGIIMSVETIGSLLCVGLLSILKFSPKARYYLMGIGFISSGLFFCGGFLTHSFPLMCVLFFLAALGNALGNAIFNAALMLALPEDNRGGIMGLVSSASTGGVALSGVFFGFLGEFFPLSIIFVVSTLISAIPMIYLCVHKHTREFILSH